MTKTMVMARKKITIIIKNAAIVEEETAVAIKTAAIIETAAIMETTVVIAKASKIFKKEAIIAARKESATLIAKTFRKGSTTSFNKKEKYIEMNGNTMTFA